MGGGQNRAQNRGIKGRKLITMPLVNSILSPNIVFSMKLERNIWKRFNTLICWKAILIFDQQQSALYFLFFIYILRSVWFAVWLGLWSTLGIWFNLLTTHKKPCSKYECPKIYCKSVLHRLKIPQIYTKADAVQISGKFWDTQYIIKPEQTLLKLFFNYHRTDSLFVNFRFGEAGHPLCTGQEGCNQDCKQREAQWKRTTKGKQASNQWLIIT